MNGPAAATVDRGRPSPVDFGRLVGPPSPRDGGATAADGRGVPATGGPDGSGASSWASPPPVGSNGDPAVAREVDLDPLVALAVGDQLRPPRRACRAGSPRRCRAGMPSARRKIGHRRGVVLAEAARKLAKHSTDETSLHSVEQVQDVGVVGEEVAVRPELLEASAAKSNVVWRRDGASADELGRAASRPRRRRGSPRPATAVQLRRRRDSPCRPPAGALAELARARALDRDQRGHRVRPVPWRSMAVEVAALAEQADRRRLVDRVGVSGENRAALEPRPA